MTGRSWDSSKRYSGRAEPSLGRDDIVSGGDGDGDGGGRISRLWLLDRSCLRVFFCLDEVPNRVERNIVRWSVCDQAGRYTP
jgi:hypothetical protein